MTSVIDSALRFRGPHLAACLRLERGVQTVTVSVASRYSVCEARCVNRSHLYSHKVPRGRAPITVALRGSARSSFSAGSPRIKLAGVRRFVGGKAWTATSLWCGPFDRSRLRRSLRCRGAEAAPETEFVRQSNSRFDRDGGAVKVVRVGVGSVIEMKGLRSMPFVAPRRGQPVR